MVKSKEEQEELFYSMEAIMVSQFRICQTLRDLSQQERKLLLDGKADELVGLVEKKEMLLDDLGKLEETRRTMTDRISQKLGFTDIENLHDLLVRVRTSSAQRLNRLREGILAIQSEIRETNRGNAALANLNIERIGALQNHLVKLMGTSSYYHQPIPAAGTNTPPMSWGMDHQA